MIKRIKTWWNGPFVQSRIHNKAFIATLIGILAQFGLLFGMHNVDTWQQIIMSALNLLFVAGAANNPTTQNSGFGDDKEVELYPEGM